MLSTFLNHQWKAFWRSRNKGTSIAAQLFLGFIFLYLLVVAIAIGFLMEPIIGKLLPGKDVFYVFNGLILYYFAVDFLMRLQLQELPTLSITPYLHLRIARQKIVNFLNIRSLFSAFNILPLFIFIPFCCTAIAEVYGPFVAIMYIVSIISLCAFNNFTAMYIKRLTTLSVKTIIGVVVVIAGMALLEYFKVLSITQISNRIFSFIALHPAAAFAFTVVALIMYFINAKYLQRNMYTEELSTSQEKKVSTAYPFLDRFGAVGVLAALELKLILRHKRTRSALIMSLLFMFYGFIFYKKLLIEKDDIRMMIFAAVFITGSSISIYGQFMFGWQAAHFDGLMVNKTNLKHFIKAKFLLFTTISTIVAIITSFYGLISPKILFIQFAAYCYNIGIGTVIVLYFATWNSKAIDLSKGSTFNYQGVSASQFILMIPYFLIPYAFYLPFALNGHPYWGIACLAFFGLLALSTRSFWVNFLAKELNKRRYKIAEGFREL
ncbi:hypothetical protein SAMN04487898_107209 [Pedobacter sp. ok626]|uniref:DUF5687 family protein n=1 Tax=Pedobacter sp. ok626 TaxID=1761882 RepID=UPI000888199B|nr:DUF5687 family protein [Pedobacter sp. ok626]SDK32663.1 hypothetical protein SAMN04487898_107209 [Pedobacter sp. ok626]